MKIKIQLILSLLFMFSFVSSFAQDLKPGDPAPLFSLKTEEGKDFDLRSREGKWTILYFYPKAGTPGCTAQAQSFKEELPNFEKLNVQVYGISTDSIKSQNEFKQAHGLNFPLLADPEGKVVELYGSKFPIFNYSKRWSFIIGPDLKILFIERDVEAKEDAKKLLEEIKKLRATTK